MTTEAVILDKRSRPLERVGLSWWIRPPVMHDPWAVQHDARGRHAGQRGRPRRREGLSSLIVACHA
jgi:hypothetical protein